jgi:hypothetical protein
MILKAAFALAAIIIAMLLVLAFLATRRAQLPIAAVSVNPAAVSSAQARLNDDLNPVPIVTGASSKSAKYPKTKTGSQINHTHLRSIHLSEADVNTVLTGSTRVVAELAAQGVTNAEVEFLEPNEVQATGVIIKDGNNQSLTVSGVLSTDGGGQIVFNPDSARLGDLSIPESLVDEPVRKESERLLQLAVNTIPIEVHSLSVSNHQLVLTGSPKTN